MLVLTRKLKEKIRIGDQIEITLLNIEGGQVQLGIKAPKDLVILREEIYQEIRESNLLSSKVSPKEFEKILKMISGGEK